MTGLSQPVNHQSSRSFVGSGQFQSREPHNHLLRGSLLDRSTLRQEFEQVHWAWHGGTSLRSADVDSCYLKGAQCTDREHVQAGSPRTATDHGRKAGVSLSLDRNEEPDSGMPRSCVERNNAGDGFIRSRWVETKEQDALGGARLTIEIGAEYPIGIMSRSGSNASPFNPAPRAWGAFLGARRPLGRSTGPTVWRPPAAAGAGPTTASTASSCGPT
jgi:hypothetical protein